MNSGDYEAAAEVFENAHAIYSDRPEVMVTLAQIYAQIGEHERSIQYTDEALGFLDSEFAQTADSATMAGWQDSMEPLPVMRAQVLGAAGRFEEAAQAFRDLSAAEPDNTEHLRNLGASSCRWETTPARWRSTRSCSAGPA